MKNLQRATLLTVILLVANSINFAQSLVAVDKHSSVADLPVTDVSIRKSNMPLALSEIAYTCNIPIGVEISPDDDVLKERNIVVQIESGTVKDLLDSVVSQNPLYAWNIEDDVINVFPKGNREPVLKSLLETRIEAFRVDPDRGRLTFRESLTESPSVKSVLAAFGVKSNNEVFSSRDIRPLSRGYSLNVSNATVKSILNRVVRESATKFWIVNLDGEKRQHLLLNL